MKVVKRKENKQYYMFVVLLYFFILKDWMEQYISFEGYFDEIFALLAVPYFVSQLYKNRFCLKVRRGGIADM